MLVAQRSHILFILLRISQGVCPAEGFPQLTAQRYQAAPDIRQFFPH